MNTQTNLTNTTCDGPATNNAKCKEIDDDIVKQFKFIMIVVLFILLAFLGFFVYNLIKCYLPKWKKQAFQTVSSSEQNETEKNVQIEFGNA